MDPQFLILNEPFIQLLERAEIDPDWYRSAALERHLESHSSKAPQMLEDIKTDLGKAMSKSRPNYGRLIHQFFAQSFAVHLEKEMEQLINSSRQEQLQQLAMEAFSQPHTVGMARLLNLIIDKSDEATLSYLAGLVFSKPHTSEMEELVLKLIERAEIIARLQRSDWSQALSNLAQNVFTKKHAQNWHKALTALINTNDGFAQKELARTVFKNPFPDAMESAFLLLVDKADKDTSKELARDCFTPERIRKYPDAFLKLLIKADYEILYELAKQMRKSDDYPESLQNFLQLFNEMAPLTGAKLKAFADDHFPFILDNTKNFSLNSIGDPPDDQPTALPTEKPEKISERHWSILKELTRDRVVHISKTPDGKLSKVHYSAGGDGLEITLWYSADKVRAITFLDLAKGPQKIDSSNGLEHFLKVVLPMAKEYETVRSQCEGFLGTLTP